MKRSELELYIIFSLMERKHWGEILKYTQLTKSLTNVLHFCINFKKETDLSLILIISPSPFRISLGIFGVLSIVEIKLEFPETS